jgi:hypothetical protein
MISYILATLFVISFCAAFAVSEVRRQKKFFEGVKKRALERAEQQAEQTKQAETADITGTLEFDLYEEFETENIPFCDDGYNSFIDILHGLNRWYKQYAAQKGRQEISDWLRPALTHLEGQCDSIDFAVTDIQNLFDMLKEKGFTTTIDGCFSKVQKVINAFTKNRAEAFTLLNQIDCTDDKKLLAKLKTTLLSLIKDNDELISGLDTFRASIRDVLAQVCEDKNPDHITDFTSLHELLEVPSLIERVIAEIHAEQAKADVPVIENIGKRTLDYFPRMTLGNNATTTTERIVDPESSVSPMSDGF